MRRVFVHTLFETLLIAFFTKSIVKLLREDEELLRLCCGIW